MVQRCSLPIFLVGQKHPNLLGQASPIGQSSLPPGSQEALYIFYVLFLKNEEEYITQTVCGPWRLQYLLSGFDRKICQSLVWKKYNFSWQKFLRNISSKEKETDSTSLRPTFPPPDSAAVALTFLPVASSLVKPLPFRLHREESSVGRTGSPGWSLVVSLRNQPHKMVSF